VPVLRRAFSFVRWLVILEIGIWRSLFFWVTRRVPGKGPGVQAFSYSNDDGAVVNVAVLKQTKVEVVLHLPTAVDLPDGAEEITGVRLYVDRPRPFVATARERLGRAKQPTSSPASR
jgi:hypothetical protein